MYHRSSRSWRVIDSGIVQPALSVALDEAILEAHVERKVPSTLHFYVRNAPTVSLGYFQKLSEAVDLEACGRLGVALVRRKSGGSAIFTDSGQLIYGLVVSEEDLPGQMDQSFEITCSCIARAIGSFGVDARFRPLNDVEVDGRKISGNAQLRRKGSLLQHGTVIVDTDTVVMDSVLRVDRTKNPDLRVPSDRIVTLASIMGDTPSMDELRNRLTEEFSVAFNVRFEGSVLTSEESSAAQRLVEESYGRPEWNKRY